MIPTPWYILLEAYKYCMLESVSWGKAGSSVPSSSTSHPSSSSRDPSYDLSNQDPSSSPSFTLPTTTLSFPGVPQPFETTLVMLRFAFGGARWRVEPRRGERHDDRRDDRRDEREGREGAMTKLGGKGGSKGGITRRAHRFASVRYRYVRFTIPSWDVELAAFVCWVIEFSEVEGSERVFEARCVVCEAGSVGFET
ncbi:hypothetical protein C8J56DRAFT_899196 [Mycena floridula]|nr:hypothetical protein C8J56DRAFT_899196 [Mycena floridula]